MLGLPSCSHSCPATASSPQRSQNDVLDLVLFCSNFSCLRVKFKIFTLTSKVLHGPPLPFGLIFSNPLLLSHIALLAALCTLQACSCLGAFASTVSSTWSTLSHTTSLPQLLCVSTQILPERGLSSEFHWNLLLCFFFTELVTIYSFSFTPYVQFLSVMLLCHSLGQLSLSAWLRLLLVQPWKGKGGRVPRNTGSCVLLQFL